MSYYTDFYLNDNTQIILPLDFFSNPKSVVSNELINLIKEKETLSKLDEDSMTVKQFKQLKTIEDMIFQIKNEQNLFTNKYGYNCFITDDFYKIHSFIDEDKFKNFVLFDNGEKITVYTKACEAYIIFEKNDIGYILKNLDGTISNNSWVQDKITDLITTFELTVTIKDAGNEEIGYIFQDGVDDESDLEDDKVYVNGKLI